MIDLGERDKVRRVKKLVALLGLVAACHRGSPIGNADLAAPEAPPDLRAPPPATPLLTLDGKQVDLAAYRKKVTLIALWGTFCEPCLKELPMLSALHDKTKDDTDVSIVAVSTDPITGDADRAHVAEVVRGMKLTIPVLLDARRVLATRFSHADGETPDAGAEAGLALPTSVVLLADGHYARKSGFDEHATQETYVSNGMATLARAEAGTLPPDEYDNTPPPDFAESASLKMPLPAMSKADLTTKWPALKKRLEGMHIPDAAIAGAEAQIRAGKPAVIEIPLSALKKK